VLESLDKALTIGISSVKLNVVAMKGFNDDEFADFAEMTRDREIDVRFIEFMPFAQNDWERDKFISYHDIRAQIKQRFSLLECGDDPKDSTSKGYRIPGFKGKLGFISSMSDHFCGGCNRLRLTADGNLKVCLFDNREVNLKHLIEAGLSDEELLEYIQKALAKKHFSHGGVDSILKRTNRPMVKIGG
jgi:GTP 3',8-cyclase / cyclic pyranopterin monophosphate synthase